MSLISVKMNLSTWVVHLYKTEDNSLHNFALLSTSKIGTILNI